MPSTTARQPQLKEARRRAAEGMSRDQAYARSRRKVAARGKTNSERRMSVASDASGASKG
jgi:hypothetical protein